MIIKTCKKHGDLTIEGIIKSGTSNGKQRYKCKQCMNDFHENHYKQNR